MNLAKINRHGQISIPAKFRKKLALKTGEFVKIDEDPAGRLILTPVSVAEKGSLTDLDLKKYEDQGVDIGLLLSSLSKTPTERAETNKAMLKFIQEMRKSKERKTDNKTHDTTSGL